jgi:hypothetical protein
MGPILIALGAVLLFVSSLFGAPWAGSFSISSMCMLVLLSFCVIYVVLTFYRVRQAAR